MDSHGKLTFNWQGNVLFVNAFGPFNDEGAEIFTKQYIETVSSRTKEKVALVELWDEHSFGGPKIMEKLTTLWLELSHLNCDALLIVVSNSMLQDIAKKCFPPTEENFCCQTFNDLDTAKDWLINNGF